MALHAYNLTGAPVTLAAANSAPPSLPASAAPPARSPAFNVTSELRPNLTVDPANGVTGGLDAAAFTAIQAQISAGTIELEWTADAEYLTGVVVPGGPSAGVLRVKLTISPDIPGSGSRIVDVQIVDDSSGADVKTATRGGLSVCDDLGLTIPANNAHLSNETAGTIRSGEGTFEVEFETDANGLFQTLLTDPVYETVHISCKQSIGSPLVDCKAVHAATFS